MKGRESGLVGAQITTHPFAWPTHIQCRFPEILPFLPRPRKKRKREKEERKAKKEKKVDTMSDHTRLELYGMSSLMQTRHVGFGQLQVVNGGGHGLQNGTSWMFEVVDCTLQRLVPR